MPDFYVLCKPKHQNHRQSISATSEKQRETDYARLREYIMTTIHTSPYRMLIFKQALKVICKEYFSFLVFFIFQLGMLSMWEL
jgi:hypothetical protein